MIWIVCFTAIVIGCSLTYSWYRDSGKDIEINFKEVNGLVPRHSKIMYRGAEIGSVTDIRLDLKTQAPIVTARIDTHPAKLIGKDSKFWIVRPEIGFGEIRNLNAIATGAYIGVDPIPGEITDSFIALDDDPIADSFECGLKIIIKTASASGIEEGSAVLYRDFKIGEVADMGLSQDKRHILITVYIAKAYKDVIRKGSYFANISGFHASIHLFGGTEISLKSLSSLMNGGLTVTTPNFNSPAAKDNDTYTMLTKQQVEALQDN